MASPLLCGRGGGGGEETKCDRRKNEHTTSILGVRFDGIKLV